MMSPELPALLSFRLLLASAALFALSRTPPAFAAIAVQTVNSAGTTTEWNDAIWGAPAVGPTGATAYFTAAGFFGSGSTSLGTGSNVTGRVRACGGASGSPAFAGDSLTIASSTELLIKSTSTTYSVDLIPNGGILQIQGGTTTLTGTLDVSAASVLGLVQASPNSSFTDGSTITGSSALRLATGQNTGHPITFDDGLGLSLNGYAGTFDIGGGSASALVDFNQAYTILLAGITMGGYTTTDVLNFDANLTVASFTTFVGDSLAGGTYSSAQAQRALRQWFAVLGRRHLRLSPSHRPRCSVALACSRFLAAVRADIG